VSGELVFERPEGKRHLVMVIESRLESPPPIPKIRRPFRATLTTRGDRLVIHAIEIRSDVEQVGDAADSDHDDGVTAAVLSATRPEAIIATSLRMIRGQRDHLQRLIDLDPKLFGHLDAREQQLREALEVVPAKPRGRGGRPVRGTEFYRAVALVCLHLYEDGGLRRGITEAVAERMTDTIGYKPALRTVEDWIRRARAQRYLAPGRSGEVWFGAGPALAGEQRKEQ